MRGQMADRLKVLLEMLCDCDGKRLNGRARELANEARELLALAGARLAAEPQDKVCPTCKRGPGYVIGAIDESKVLRDYPTEIPIGSTTMNTPALARVPDHPPAEAKTSEYDAGFKDGVNCECTICSERRKQMKQALAGTPEPSEANELLAASQKVMELIDSGMLVRSTRCDHERDWAIKQLPMVRALAQFAEAIEKAAGTP